MPCQELLSVVCTTPYFSETAWAGAHARLSPWQRDTIRKMSSLTAMCTAVQGNSVNSILISLLRTTVSNSFLFRER
jgi:hypothetical protein